jgi:multimeric flavodoxin WrbA
MSIVFENEDSKMKPRRRVLGIVASPHNSGNTATLVKAVLKGAEEKGYETELRCLGDLKLLPLVESTSEPYDVAGPKDDVESIFSSLEKMDIVVFGTPIYFGHVSDRAKIFIDRLIYYEKPERKARLPKGASAIIIITYADDRPKLYDGVIEWLKDVMKYLNGMKVVATLKAEGTDEKPVEKRKDLLEKARKLGESL